MMINAKKHERTKLPACYSNSVDNPVANITIMTLMISDLLHRSRPLFTFRAFCVVSPAFVVGGAFVVTFRSNCVGNIFGVAECWNIGASGDPSNWNI